MSFLRNIYSRVASLFHLLLSSSMVLFWKVVLMARSPRTHVIVGAGLLNLVMHVTLSVLLSVTVNSPPGLTEVLEDCMEIEDGGTVEE